VAWNGSSFLVTWADTRSGSSDIYGTKVRTDGTVVDPGGRPISTAAGDQTWPAVRALGSTWLVAWQDGRSGGSADVYATRVGSAGTVLNPSGIAIATAARDQLRPAVAAGDTTWYVTWADRRNAPTSGTDVYATRVSSTGKPVSTAGTAVSRAAGDQWSPAVAWDGASYLVVWADERSGAGTDVYGARVGSDGGVRDAAGVPISKRPGTQAWPAVSANGDQFIVVWNDDRSATSVDIYGTLVDDSATVTVIDGFAVSTAARDQLRPAVGALGGTYLAAWADRRSGSGWDIYATRIDTAGKVLKSGGFKVAA
jgi:hypothetical protein